MNDKKGLNDAHLLAKNKRKDLNNMDGVEILSSEIIYNTFLPRIWITLGLIFGWVFVYLFIASLIEGCDILPWIFAPLIIVFIVISILGCASNKNDINYIEYKTTIDDSVSMNEFLDKYEILDQEGKIYTVKERK